jgi:hypothetical protein
MVATLFRNQSFLFGIIFYILLFKNGRNCYLCPQKGMGNINVKLLHQFVSMNLYISEHGEEAD